MDFENRTREEREELVRLKMEEMKKKNEEILRRHLEIEADKQMADLHSQTVIANKKNNPQPSVPPRERTTPNAASRRVRPQAVPKQEISRENEEKRQQRLSETEAPPPDPNFNFLSDPLRDTLSETQKDLAEKDKAKRHKNNYGGEDFENVRVSMRKQKIFDKDNPMSPPKNKMEMSLRMTGRERKEYEDWKKERERVDHDRMARQKMSGGRWSREWDNEKINQDEDCEKPHNPDEYYRSPQWDTGPSRVPGDAKPPFGKGRGRGRGRNRQSSQSSDHEENIPFQRRSSPVQQRQLNRSNSNNSWSSASSDSPNTQSQGNWFKQKTSHSPEPKAKMAPRGRFAQPKRDPGLKSVEYWDYNLDDSLADMQTSKPPSDLDLALSFYSGESWNEKKAKEDMSSLKIQVKNESWRRDWEASPNGQSFSDSWKEDDAPKPQRIVSIEPLTNETQTAKSTTQPGCDNNLAELKSSNNLFAKGLKARDQSDTEIDAIDDNEDGWEDISASEDDELETIITKQMCESINEIETTSSTVNQPIKSQDLDNIEVVTEMTVSPLEVTMTIHDEDSGIHLDRSNNDTSQDLVEPETATKEVN